MVAGEVRNPRPVLKKAFKTVYIRFALFFIGSAVFVDIALPPNDPTLNRILSTGNGAGTGAASPYVIAMQNLGVDGLPHLVVCFRGFSFSRFLQQLPASTDPISLTNHLPMA